MRWWHFYSEKIMGRGNIKNVLLETAKIQKQQLSGVAREQQSSNVYIEELLVDLRVLAKLLQRPGVGRELGIGERWHSL